MPLLTKNSSIEVSSRKQPFYAKKQTYNLGQQVQIEVDVQREFIDFQNSRLIGNIVTNNSGANAELVNWGASQLIKNLRVKTLAGQMIGHEIREYRAFYQMYKELTSNSDKNESWDDVMELSQGFAFTDTTAQQIQFAHKFIAHLFSIKQYYPAHFHQGIMIEFDLPSAAPLELIRKGAGGALTAPTITIQDLKYVARLVQLKPEIENKLASMMEQQRLFADYKEVLTQENTIAASAGLQAYDVIGIDGRVKGIYQYTIADVDKDVTTNASSNFSIWGRNDLGSYRFKLGANYLNYESIQCNEAAAESQRAEQIFDLVEALNFHDDNAYATKAGDSALTRAALNASRFAIAVKVDKAQKNADQTISSMIDKDRNNVRVELNFDASPGAATSYTHITLDKRIQILPGSIVRNVRS